MWLDGTTFGGMTCRCKRPETISKQALEGAQKMTAIMARATTWASRLWDACHHATQNAAPALDAIMRRSSRADRGPPPLAEPVDGCSRDDCLQLKALI
jgi:hypothetical protein